MARSIVDLLNSQIEETVFKQTQKMRWLVSELVTLKPTFEEFLPIDFKVFNTVGQRALCSELKCEHANFASIWEVIEASMMTPDELQTFAEQAELITGLWLATDTWPEFIEEKRGANECKHCALALRLVALSATVLTEAFPLPLAKEIAHGRGGLMMYEHLQMSLEEITPAKI